MHRLPVGSLRPSRTVSEAPMLPCVDPDSERHESLVLPRCRGDVGAASTTRRSVWTATD